MKYCSHCGAELNDEAVVCVKCGCAVDDEIVHPTQVTSNQDSKTYKLIAFVFCIISIVSVGWFLLPLAWMIPMTMKVYDAYKHNTKLSTGFSVCTLIFLSLVAGILLLVDGAENN